jgi:peptidyl-prolyl cis-trans isomerase SurA
LKSASRAAALALVLAGATALAATAPPKAPTRTPARPAPPPASAPAARPPAATRPAGDGEALDAVAAMVNDEAVLVSDVEEQLYLYLQQTGLHPDSTQVDTLRRQVLNQLVDEKLLQGEARRQGIVVTDAEIARQVDQALASARERIGGEAAFQEQLKRENMSEAQLREKYRGDLRKELAVEKLKRKQIPSRTVPQAEAEAYFLAHRDKFPRVPGEVQLQVVQIPPQPESTAVLAGLAKAQAVRKRLVSGERFAKVAAEASEDPGSANSGGDLGFFTHGRMEKNVEVAAFGLKLNEISEPVRSPYGWHIVQPLERDTVRSVAGRDSIDDAGKPVIEAHARHILIRVTPTDLDVERAHALAEHVRDEARKGTSFTTLVHRYSRFEGAANADGDVGFVSLGNLQPQIRAGLDSLEIGQVSEVLTNQAGFNVFRVVDRHPERDYSVEEVRNELPDAVAQAQYREKLEAYLKSLRAKAQIDVRMP